MRKLLLASALISSLLAVNSMAKSCGSDKKDDSKKSEKSNHKHNKVKLIHEVVEAVSKCSLTIEQMKDIKIALRNYKVKKMQLKQNKKFPFEAFKSGEFNREAFIKSKSDRYSEKLESKADLFEIIYTVLDESQRAIFEREFLADYTEKEIMKSLKNSKRGKGCGSKGGC